MLAEGAYLLKVPRPFAPPGDENNSTGPDPVELSPAQIKAKLEGDPVLWNAKIEALRNVGLEVLEIVKKKDAKELWDAADNLDQACESVSSQLLVSGRKGSAPATRSASRRAVRHPRRSHQKTRHGSQVIRLALASIAVTATMFGQSLATPTALAPLQFLLGEWEGVGDQAGATGRFTFAPGVQDRVVVRTNYSNTPASGSTPASRHDDLMVIYVDGGLVKADYFDNEGHVIRYVAEIRAGQVVFLSEIRASEPRYRLAYARASATTLDGSFAVAPPGHPDAFSPYLSWTARKVK